MAFIHIIYLSGAAGTESFMFSYYAAGALNFSFNC